MSLYATLSYYPLHYIRVPFLFLHLVLKTANMNALDINYKRNIIII